MSATLGIDLASKPKSTALCLVEWASDGAAVQALWRGVASDGVTPLHDKLLAAAIRGDWGGGLRPCSKVAVDAPLGWPADFVQALRAPAAWPVALDHDRRRLERRATDHWIHDRTKKQPLSVSTDRIAYAAMRAAGLVADYTRITGQAVDRTGETGLICEAYPDPAIRALGLWPDAAPQRQSYKGDAEGLRRAVMQRLKDTAPWLSITREDFDACVSSDDCLDALICALVARATELGHTEDIPHASRAEASEEGWIRLPTYGSLSRLVGA